MCWCKRNLVQGEWKWNGWGWVVGFANFRHNKIICINCPIVFGFFVLFCAVYVQNRKSHIRKGDVWWALLDLNFDTFKVKLSSQLFLLSFPKKKNKKISMQFEGMKLSTFQRNNLFFCVAKIIFGFHVQCQQTFKSGNEMIYCISYVVTSTLLCTWDIVMRFTFRTED